MFDSVLRRETLPKRRFGSGAIIAILVHIGAISFAIWASASGAMQRVQDVAVTFVKPPPPPPPPPPAAPRQVRPKVKPEQQRTVLQQAIVAPTVIPDEKPPEQEPIDQPTNAGEGIAGGEVGGVPGGIPGGVVESAGPIQFDANRMTDPKFMSGPKLEYTEKAREREVEGTMVVKCVLTAEGRVHDCRVVRSLPFMDRAVIDALERRRYTPVTMGGRPIEVDYTFRIPFRLTD